MELDQGIIGACAIFSIEYRRSLSAVCLLISRFKVIQIKLALKSPNLKFENKHCSIFISHYFLLQISNFRSILGQAFIISKRDILVIEYNFKLT